MSGKKSITDIEYSYSIWSTGGTVLAQGCLQLAPPDHFYWQLWAFGSGTVSRHSTSFSNFEKEAKWD